VADDPLELIKTDGTVLHGQARLRGTRIAVSVVLDCLAAGMTEPEIRGQYRSLPVGAARAAIAYGALLARDELPPLDSSER
jgi:uncharacterized protein (DUF433 family)